MAGLQVAQFGFDAEQLADEVFEKGATAMINSEACFAGE